MLSFLRLTDKHLDVTFGKEWKESNPTNKRNGFREMINTFRSVPSEKTYLINHALAQYFSKKYINLNPSLHNVAITATGIKEFISSDLSFINNNQYASFIIDCEYIANLTYKYAIYFDSIIFHDALPNINVLVDEDCYGFRGFGLSQVMSVEEYVGITRDRDLFFTLQINVVLGLKALKAYRCQ